MMSKRAGAAASGKFVVLLFAVAALASYAPRAAWAHARPMSPEDMVHWSGAIVVGVVEAADGRWNRTQTLIETEYTVLVEEWLKGEGAEVLTFTMPGGVLGELEDDTCLTVPLTVGARHLLFLDDPAQPLFSPLTGAGQGAFEEALGADGRTPIVRSAGGSLPMSSRRPEVPFEEFLAGVRAFVAQVESTPWQRPPREEDPELPTRAFDPSDRTTDPDPRAPAGRLAAEPPAPSGANVAAEAGGEPIRRATLPRGREKYKWKGKADTPIGWNAIPTSWTWYPHDQYMMTYWNFYGGGVHYVIGPYNTWAYGNGRFDIAGFPNNASMNNQFGRSWGSNELGVTFSRKNVWGDLSEADIALNPAFQWTLDNEQGARSDTTPWSFEQTMLHELGHGHGLKHPWEYQNVWWDSVMNYAPKDNRMPILAADDAEAIRDEYYYLAAHDGMISAFSTYDTNGSNKATYATFGPVSPLVVQGATLSFTGEFKIETPGTDYLSSLQVEVYLCPKRFDWAGCKHLKTVNYGGIIPPFTTWTYAGSSLGSYSVPTNFATGVYYPALNLKASGTDEVPVNNASWANYDKTVTVKVKSGCATSEGGGGWAALALLPAALLAARRRRARASSG